MRSTIRFMAGSSGLASFLMRSVASCASRLAACGIAFSVYKHSQQSFSARDFVHEKHFPWITEVGRHQVPFPTSACPENTL